MPEAANIPGSEAHNAAMIAAFESQGGVATVRVPETDAAGRPLAETAGTPAEGAPQRPEHIPAKFWNAETGAVDYDALAKSYTELEKKATTKPAPAPKPADPPTPPVTRKVAVLNEDGTVKMGEDGKPVVEEIEVAPKVEPAKTPTEAGIPKASMERFNAEYAADGKLTDASYTELEGLGIGREMVDAYIAGQVALAEADNAAIAKAAGGPDAFEAMCKWAAQALDEAAIDAFDTAMASGNRAAKEQAVLGLKGRYEAAMGSPEALLGAENGAAAKSTAGYSSQAEMIADMSDSRYTTDAAFQARVMARLANTQDGLF